MAKLFSQLSPQPKAAALPKELKDRISAVERRPQDHMAWNLAFNSLSRNLAVFSNWKVGQQLLDRLENKIPCLVDGGQYADASRAYLRMKQILETLENSPFAQKYIDYQKYVDYYSQKATEFMRRHNLSQTDEKLFNIQAAAYDLHTHYIKLHTKQWTMDFSVTLGRVSDPKHTILELNKMVNQWQALGNHSDANQIRHMIGTLQLCYNAVACASGKSVGLPSKTNFFPFAFIEPRLLYVDLYHHRNYSAKDIKLRPVENWSLIGDIYSGRN